MVDQPICILTPVKIRTAVARGRMTRSIQPVQLEVRMKWGILCRAESLWIGAHWSPYNKRLCLNLVPFVTLWIAAKNGIVPKHGFDIYRSDSAERNEEKAMEQRVKARQADEALARKLMQVIGR